MKQVFAKLLLLIGFTSLFASDDLLIQDTKIGLGKEAVRGTTVTVHYTGKLTNGKVFDSSVDRGEPFQFDLGAGQVIQGWEKGIVGMKEGGKRKLTIPPKMGYGNRPVGPIPANSTLIFEVELLKVK
ncbi:MAG: FKBP-type peptidyl-prolyl cis-trans isomerase [Leptospira sp.]|jgi:FKBP-type peptidyl-prolyl cis-trans isomerase|nr:FKBP-type peptidyl-prolyl cis-trans isomerase [Leptospira sp.]